MQNQLMQVKTQVAIAVADRPLLEKKRKQALEAEADLLRKAELGLAKGKDEAARKAVEEAVSQRQTSAVLARQLGDQNDQVERLKQALDALVVQHRRARAVTRASQANGELAVDFGRDNVFDRVQQRVLSAEAMGEALTELAAPSPGEELAALQRDDEVEAILRDLLSCRF
jgi:phage shock protein A